MDAILDGVRVRLTLYWNPRAQAWFLDAELPGIAKLTTGRQVAMYSPLLRSGRLQGDLFALPQGGETGEPGREAWGRTHQMAYR